MRFLKVEIIFTWAPRLECCVMCETLQKMRDMNATVQHIHVVYVNLRQWKSSAVENHKL